MPLDGLRAWIGEVERKLRMRTRVFLVLATIAIGGAGAAIYLAVDTRDNAVSESDVQELQEDLEAQIGAGGVAGAGANTTQLETELKALEAEVEKLRGRGGSGQAGGAAAEGETTPEGSSARLRELAEQAREASKQAEEAQQDK